MIIEHIETYFFIYLMSSDMIYELYYHVSISNNNTITVNKLKQRFNFIDLHDFLLNNLNNPEITINTLFKDNKHTKHIVLYTSDMPNVTANDYIGNYKTLTNMYGPNAVDNNDKILCNLLCKV